MKLTPFLFLAFLVFLQNSSANFINILRSLFTMKFWCQKIPNPKHSFVIFGTKIAAQNALVKCWWNWHLVLQNQNQKAGKVIFWTLIFILRVFEGSRERKWCCIYFRFFRLRISDVENIKFIWERSTTTPTATTSSSTAATTLVTIISKNLNLSAFKYQIYG